MKRVLLDTNVWGDLLETPDYPLSPALLRELAREKRVEVLGTPYVQEEIGAIAGSRPDHCSRALALYGDLVGFRCLQPLNRRIAREGDQGGLLPLANRYLERSLQREINNLIADSRILEEMNDERDQRLAIERQTYQAARDSARDRVKTGNIRVNGIEETKISTDGLRDIVALV